MTNEFSHQASEIALNLKEATHESLVEIAEAVNAELKSRQKTRVKEAREAIRNVAKNHGLTIGEILGYEVKDLAEPKRAPVKFQNPDDLKQTWTGRGKKPTWYVDLVHVHGVAPESLLVNQQQGA